MKKKAFLLILFLAYSSAKIFTQNEVARIPEQPLFFYFDLLNFYSYNEKHSRLDVFLQVPYRNLQFIKHSEHFKASYEVNIDIFNSDKQLEVQKTYVRELPIKDFNETVSKQNYDLSQRSFNLKPGKYNIEITLTDNDSKKYLKAKKDFEIRNFEEKKVDISDLMLISKISNDNGKQMIVPNVSGNVGNLPEGFNVFFEIYSKEILNDSVFVAYTVVNKKDDKMFDSTFKYFVHENVSSVLFKVENKNLIFGDYRIYVKIISEKRKELFDKVGIGRLFLVRWQDMPVSINDLNLAIQQMQYIATGNEVDEIRDTKDDKENQKKFLEFWKDRKPGMEEYYARIDYANRQFKSHREGWKTDMGMVFITFGAPDNVDRHPFDVESVPYEVWDYYAINRRFIFVDESGFGEYKLLYPIWDKSIRIH